MTVYCRNMALDVRLQCRNTTLHEKAGAEVLRRKKNPTIDENKVFKSRKICESSEQV